jgi:hypothetical protein
LIDILKQKHSKEVHANDDFFFVCGRGGDTRKASLEYQSQDGGVQRSWQGEESAGTIEAYESLLERLRSESTGNS